MRFNPGLTRTSSALPAAGCRTRGGGGCRSDGSAVVDRINVRGSRQRAWQQHTQLASGSKLLNHASIARSFV